jgi:hypothetical protein
MVVYIRKSHGQIFLGKGKYEQEKTCVEKGL